MTTISRDQLICAMGQAAEPAVRIQPGETIVVETEDCFGHQVVDAAYSLDEPLKYDYVNPATGPIFVEGARAGDVLKVHIEEINLDPAGGVASTCKGWGALGDRVKGSNVRILEIQGDTAVMEELRIPLNPMIGVIGVAPASGSVPNSTPGPHGGNLDTIEITRGATVYLPVFVDGAYLALGDLHAAMGDGEVCGAGGEIRGSVRMRVDIAQGRTWDHPVVENDAAFYFLGSAPGYDEAIEIAVAAAVKFISEENHISWEDAYMLASLRCDLRFSQIVNPWKTVKMRVPKKLLK